MIPCKKCGICCTMELCSRGRRKDKNKKGNCIYLIKNNNGTTSCKLILENKMNGCSINFEEGCVFQENYPASYEFYSNLLLEKGR